MVIVMSDGTASYQQSLFDSWSASADTIGIVFKRMKPVFESLGDILMDAMTGYVPACDVRDKHIRKLQGRIGWNRKQNVIGKGLVVNVKPLQLRVRYSLR